VTGTGMNRRGAEMMIATIVDAEVLNVAGVATGMRGEDSAATSFHCSVSMKTPAKGPILTGSTLISALGICLAVTDNKSARLAITNEPITHAQKLSCSDCLLALERCTSLVPLLSR
jgi:hypothetical protein